MPTFMIESSHSPDNCPILNEKTRKMSMEGFQVMEELTKNYGLKVLGDYMVMPEHKDYMIIEAPSTDAFQKAMSDPRVVRMLAVQVSQIKAVMTMEEGMKMLQSLGAS